MLAIFIVWAGVLVFALVRFRQGAHPHARRDGVRGVWPALAIGAIVAGDVVILGTRALPAWSARMAPPPALSAPLEVRITAEQFAWNIHYAGPDGVFGRTSAQLISPSNPVGHRSRRRRGKRRHRTAQHPDAAARSHRRRAAGKPRRDPQLHPAGDAGEAGCDARDDRPRVVHADATPAIGRSPAHNCAAWVTTACAANTTC